MSQLTLPNIPDVARMRAALHDDVTYTLCICASALENLCKDLPQLAQSRPDVFEARDRAHATLDGVFKP